MAKDKRKYPETNPDPITGSPGAHPVGVGLGAAAGGAAAGAAAGTVAGPAGTLAGAAIGAVVGGLAGKAAAEAIDPTIEDAYWSKQYVSEPYYEKGFDYSDYQPAYRTGYEGRARVEGVRTFDEVERDLEADYNSRRADSRLSWEQGRPAAEAAWRRADRIRQEGSQP